ncbi:MAG: HAD hydrolase-like protein [Paracoccaceae bacterium]
MARGFAPLTLDQVRSFVGRGVPHLVRCLLETSGENPDGPLHGEICATLIERYETQLEGNHFYPGVRAALDQLRDHGHRLAICTNKPYGPAEAVLFHLGIPRSVRRGDRRRQPAHAQARARDAPCRA